MLRTALVLAALLAASIAHGRDLGQWDKVDPQVRAWFESLKMPDMPSTSCCGESDAYWADSYEVGPNGEYVAIITDERDDAPLKRPHVPVGTKVIIPKHKLKFDQGNPTGHGIVFLSWSMLVYCYLPPGGI